MRKNMILWTMAALMAGCSSEEVVEEMGQSPIGFRAVTSHTIMSRVNETNGESLKGSPFDVYAFTQEKGKLFMGKQLSPAENEISIGVEIKYDEQQSAWDYADPADKAYWPIEKLNFYAFHPQQDPSAGYSIEVASASQQTVQYALPTHVDKQKDILYAISRGVDRNTHNGKVKLTFKHALSQVVFRARTQLASMKVDIEDFKLHNLAIQGKLVLPQDKEEIVRTDWKLSEVEHVVYEPKDMDKAVQNIGTDAQTLTAKLYLPQALKAWTPASHTIEQANKALQSYLSVLCKIRQHGTLLWGSEDKYVRLFVPFGATWEPGKRYVYTLVFGGGYDDQGHLVLKPMEFETEVNSMEDTLQEVESHVGIPSRKD